MLQKNKCVKQKQEKKTIAYISGTRADFGLMTSVLSAIERTSELDLQIFATGMHLMPKYGYTFKEVKEFFPNVQKIHVLIEHDTQEALSYFLSDCTKEIIRVFVRKRPDMVLVLGDRAEMLAVSLACHYLGIPVGHIHGGDNTGTIDEITRHAITKLSHIHFAATRDAARIIRQMGEESWRIHMVGSPSLDRILSKQMIPKTHVYKFLHMQFLQKYILLTLHPETDSKIQNQKNICEVLSAVHTFDIPVVVIYPNADPGNIIMIKEIEKYRRNPLFRIYQSVPYDLFLAIEKNASVWVGNSSAGIIESASFHKPVVNIGNRQEGRVKTKNVIDVPFRKKAIVEAIKRSLTDADFLRMIAAVRNPWGDGKSGDRIVRIISALKINQKFLTKKFEK